MPYFTAYNGTDRPVVIDGEGRTLGGREWGPVLSTEDAVKAAIADGRLVKVQPTDDAVPAAAAAFAATAELESARGSADTELEAAEATKATPTKRARKAAATEEN